MTSISSVPPSPNEKAEPPPGVTKHTMQAPKKVLIQRLRQQEEEKAAAAQGKNKDSNSEHSSSEDELDYKPLSVSSFLNENELKGVLSPMTPGSMSNLGNVFSPSQLLSPASVAPPSDYDVKSPYCAGAGNDSFKSAQYNGKQSAHKKYEAPNGKGLNGDKDGGDSGFELSPSNKRVRLSCDSEEAINSPRESVRSGVSVEDRELTLEEQRLLLAELRERRAAMKELGRELPLSVPQLPIASPCSSVASVMGSPQSGKGSKMISPAASPARSPGRKSSKDPYDAYGQNEKPGKKGSSASAAGANHEYAHGVVDYSIGKGDRSYEKDEYDNEKERSCYNNVQRKRHKGKDISIYLQQYKEQQIEEERRREQERREEQQRLQQIQREYEERRVRELEEQQRRREYENRMIEEERRKRERSDFEYKLQQERLYEMERKRQRELMKQQSIEREYEHHRQRNAMEHQRNMNTHAYEHERRLSAENPIYSPYHSGAPQVHSAIPRSESGYQADYSTDRLGDHYIPPAHSHHPKTNYSLPLNSHSPGDGNSQSQYSHETRLRETVSECLDSLGPRSHPYQRHSEESGCERVAHKSHNSVPAQHPVSPEKMHGSHGHRSSHQQSVGHRGESSSDPFDSSNILQGQDVLLVEEVKDKSLDLGLECLYDPKVQIKVEQPDFMDGEDSHVGSMGDVPNGNLNFDECQTCQVCGDIAAGFHCGAYVCEACKKFFVRCIKAENGPKFLCPRNKNCSITKETRTQCQYCRFQKCLSLGMYRPGGTNISAEIGHIPCKVCGAPSSGYHFGAITCEGCKGFFRRTVKERDSMKYQCSRNAQCVITVSTRNVCKFCRYKKCLDIGMKPDGSRIGRQPNAVKHATMIELNQIKVAKGLPLNFDVSTKIEPTTPTSNFDGPMQFHDHSSVKSIAEAAVAAVMVSSSTTTCTTTTATAASASAHMYTSPQHTSSAYSSSSNSNVSKHPPFHSPHHHPYSHHDLSPQPLRPSYSLSNPGRALPPPSQPHPHHRQSSIQQQQERSAHSVQSYSSQTMSTSPPGIMPPPQQMHSHGSPPGVMSPAAVAAATSQNSCHSSSSQSSTTQATSCPSPAPAPKTENRRPYSGLQLDAQLTTVIEVVTRACKELGVLRMRTSKLPKDIIGSSRKETWDHMMCQFAQCAMGTLKFAKKIPGFRKMSIPDQITKLQTCMYPVVLTMLSLDYDPVDNHYNYFCFTDEERNYIFDYYPDFKLLIPTFHNVGSSVAWLDMDETEVGFLCAMLLLNDPSSAEYQELMFLALQEYCNTESNCLRVSEIVLRLCELARANVIHQRSVIKIATDPQNVDLDMPQLFKETYLND